MNNLTAIVAGGEFPTHPVPLSILNNAQQIVCCDGAFANLPQQFHSKIVAVVGDGDSLCQNLRNALGDKYIVVADQETNDLTKAVNFCLQHQWTDIKIVGGTGLREDHTIGNIALLAEYMQNANIEMVTDYGTFSPISSTSCFDSFPRQQVSIFSLNPNTLITAQGLEYPILNRCFTALWQGTLNAAIGNNFTLITNGPLIVFRTHEPKIVR